MNQRIIGIAVAAVAAVALLIWLLVSSSGPAGPGAGVTSTEDLPPPTPAPEQRIMLLFPGSDGLLHPELRSIPLPDELHVRIRAVLDALLAGPTGNLAPVVPYEAQVQAVFLDNRGNAFIDLSAPPAPLQGSSTELLLTYGVVDSVLLNCPELRAVQLLFGGREVPTLTGHVDLSRPLPLNKQFIAAS